MTEWGIFNGEGLLEGQFYSFDEAINALADSYTYDAEAYVGKICPDHEEREAMTCEICMAEEEGE